MEEEIVKHLKQAHFKPRTILKIGACIGSDAKILMEFQPKVIVWVEPNPHLRSTLEKNIRENTLDAVNYIVSRAIYDKDDQDVDFLIMSDVAQTNPGCSSLFKPTKQLEYYPHIQLVGAEKVRTITIDTIVTKLDRNSIDFIIMDVQGCELKALQGAKETLKLPSLKCIYLEVQTEQLYENTPLVEEIDEYLKQFGYQRIETRMMHKSWGDALYYKQ